MAMLDHNQCLLSRTARDFRGLLWRNGWGREEHQLSCIYTWMEDDVMRILKVELFAEYPQAM